MKLCCKKLGVGVFVLIGIVALLSTSLASESEKISLQRYTETRRIYANLSISGGTASCSGYVLPNGTQDCSLVVTLYRLDGGDWHFVTSWSDSATGGARAAVSASYGVEAGTYKVVSVGTVNGEKTSAESAQKTYGSTNP